MGFKDAYFFRHDANASSDLKLKALRKKYSWEGQGWYWFIVEGLRSEADYQLPYSDFTFESLSEDMKCEPNKVKEFIDDCIEKYQLFNRNGKSEYFYSERLNRDMKKLDILREQRSRGGQASALKKGFGKTDPASKELSPKLAEFIKIYEDNIGMLTPNLLDRLKDMSETYSVEKFRKVIAENPGKPLSYIEKVLENPKGKPEEKLKSTGMQVNE